MSLLKTAPLRTNVISGGVVFCLGDLASQGTKPMLYTIAVLLIILWLLGFLSGAAIGGFIHILLVIAVIMILVNLISGSKRK